MSAGAASKRTVFLVHGRDEPARQSMEALLRAFDLKVITWRRAAMLAGGGSPFTRDVVAAGIRHADAVVVLLTPDDVGYLRPKFVHDRDAAHEREPTAQPRMNVLFEAGMAMAQHEKAVVLVEVGAVRPMSDIDGINVVRLDDGIERRRDLAARLEAAGLTVDMDDDTWRTAGAFVPDTLTPDDLAPIGLAKPNLTAATPSSSAVGAAEATREDTGKGQAYLAFWEAFLHRVRSDATLSWVRARATRRDNWMLLETRKPGSYVIGFVSGARLRAEYYIDSGDAGANLLTLTTLEQHRDVIEANFGQSLSWEDLPGRRACRIAAYADGDVMDSARRDEYIAWFASSATRLREAITPFTP